MGVQDEETNLILVELYKWQVYKLAISLFNEAWNTWPPN